MIKNLPANWGDEGSIPGSERSPGEGNSNPLQYSCLENSMDKEPGGLQSTGLQRVRHHWATHEHLKIMKWQWFSILATSHRLPSSKTDISSHLLGPPLSFQRVCSSKLQTGIQPAEMQRGLSVQWHDCVRDAEQWPKWLHILLMSRGVGRSSCFGRGWYFLLVSWAGEKAKITYCKST